MNFLRRVLGKRDRSGYRSVSSPDCVSHVLPRLSSPFVLAELDVQISHMPAYIADDQQARSALMEFGQRRGEACLEVVRSELACREMKHTALWLSLDVEAYTRVAKRVRCARCSLWLVHEPERSESISGFTRIVHEALSLRPLCVRLSIVEMDREGEVIRMVV